MHCKACIIAAGIIGSQGPITFGEFVPGSIQVWNAGLKRAHWADDDYHGNFDAPQFERWFTDLCITLQSKYGGCNIHMDGASYHKRNLNKSPTMGWVKDLMVGWVKGMSALQ